MLASDAAIGAKRALLADFLRRLRLARDWGAARPDDQARVWAEQTGFPIPVGQGVVRTANTRTVAIDDAVIAAQQRVADFFYAVRVIPAAQITRGSFDGSFNAAVFA